MKVILIIAFFLIVPFADAQIDSLKLAEQYHKSADSLYQLGDYMEARTKEYWALTFEGKMKVNEPISGLYKTLDSLIEFVVSDTTKYEYYLVPARRYLAEGNIEYAYTYYGYALQYLALPNDHFEQTMDSIIFTWPTDTIFATPQKPARQLYYSPYSPYRPSNKFFIPHSQMSGQDTVYIRKDSSLFTGVYICKLPRNEWWREYGFNLVGYSLLVYHYENGVQQDYTIYNHHFKPKDFTQKIYHPDSVFLREPEPIGQETYLESIVNHGEGFSIRFTPSGDTLFLQYVDNSGVGKTIEFSPEGDTLSISKNSRNEDGSSESYSVGFNIEHKIIYEKREYNFKDSSYSTSYSLNETGDTIRFDTWVNGQICGYHIDDVYTQDSILILKTYWDKFQLLDILIDSAIFIGYDNEIISEQEFILLMPEFSTDFRVDSVPKELQSEVPFKYMFFLPGEKRPSDNWKTRTKKVKKISKRYQKTLE